MKKNNILFVTLFVLLFVSAFSQNPSKFYLTGYNGSGACDGTLKYSLCGISSATYQLLPSNGYTTISGGYENLCYASYTLTALTSSPSVSYYAIFNYSSNGVTYCNMLTPSNTTTLTAFATNISNTGVSPSCNGSFTLNVAGGVSPYNVTWYNSSNSAISTSTGSATTYTIGQLCSGNYSFDITDNNPMLCSGDWVYKPTIIHIPCYISDLSCSISVTPASSSSNCDGSASLISTSPTYSMTSFVGSTSSTNQTILTNQCYGNVTATIYDVTGAITQCTNTISFSTNISDVNKVNTLFIFPNPAIDVLNIDISTSLDVTKSLTIKITDVLGKELVLTDYQNQINISHLETGIYFVSILQGNKTLVTKKVIKE